MKALDLDTPLLELSDNDSNKTVWTIRHAVEGVQIFGGIGSGKTSGSGRTLALKYLKAGFGGLVLTAKPDEKQLWTDYCDLTQRHADLLVLEPDSGQFFNFLEYESGKAGKSYTENIVDVMKTVIHASEEKASGSGQDPFWETALDMLIFNVIDLCKLAYGKVSVQEMFDIVQTLPKPMVKKDENSPFQTAMDKARDNVELAISEWEDKQDTDYLEQLQTEKTQNKATLDNVPEARTFHYIDHFFYDNFLNLSDKTRSIVEFSFSGFLHRLVREPVFSLFCCNKSTFAPEDCLNGKVILLNLPVKTYHKVGRDCQVMFKYIWQRAMEKRNVLDNPRPVFLWADEAQHFLHEHDAEYQATARSSRIATVYISQNMPNYYANMGGSKSEFRVKSFLGTLGTKIFHSNADVETNKYASEIIGEGLFEETSKGVALADKFSTSKNFVTRYDRIVRPEAFVRLKTGGKDNNNIVEAWFHRQGKMNGLPENHVKVAFNQSYIPNP